ncbi:hypothetical protein Hypma_008148 [Hypsizygus marmoreus]|uniref:Uncharacterized protein n=1 Tax=Hypsizygus marmoreus TaxID=39966 RepID=A0A369JSI0_HYPMA|nr:hypothetical protein Hypma_008148 [Hypsizygus marmoreus]
MAIHPPSTPERSSPFSMASLMGTMGILHLDIASDTVVPSYTVFIPFLTSKSSDQVPAMETVIHTLKNCMGTMGSSHGDAAETSGKSLSWNSPPAF